MEVLSQAKKERLKILLCAGDHSVVKCDVIIDYIQPGSTEESLRSPASVSLSVEEDSEQGLLPWTVHKTSVNRLHALCPEIIYIVLPRWDRISHVKNLAIRFNQALSEAINRVPLTNKIALADVSSAPFNYPVDFYSGSLLSLLEASRNLIFDTVIIFVNSVNCKRMFEEKLSTLGFQVGFGKHVTPYELIDFNKMFESVLHQDQSEGPQETVCILHRNMSSCLAILLCVVGQVFRIGAAKCGYIIKSTDTTTSSLMHYLRRRVGGLHDTLF